MKKILPIILIGAVIVGLGAWWFSIHNLPVNEAAASVRSHVAGELGISEDAVILITTYAKAWPNGCLGLGGDKACIQAIVPGYEVTVKAGGMERIYRTNIDGTLVVSVK